MHNKPTIGLRIKSAVYSSSTLCILLGIVVLFAAANLIFMNYNFLSANNLSVIINQASFLAMLGVAQVLTMLVGGVNLSIGATMTFTTVLFGPLLVESAGQSPFLAPVLMILVGCVIGAVNGVLIAKFRLPAFIVTFSIMYVLRGAAWLIVGKTVYFQINEEIRLLAQKQIFNFENFYINMPTLICFIIIAGFSLLLRRTVFGHKMYFTGANPTAARFSGIAADRIIIIVYVLSGALSAFCGVMYAARVNACDGSMYTKSHFDALTVALISGASMRGGFGSVWGCALGALIIAVIQNGMNTLKIQSELQTLVLGIFLILSVFINDLLINKRIEISGLLTVDTQPSHKKELKLEGLK